MDFMFLLPLLVQGFFIGVALPKPQASFELALLKMLECSLSILNKSNFKSRRLLVPILCFA